ncbi:1683_t:CDS:2, partial [Scutellospora calospora]
MLNNDIDDFLGDYTSENSVINQTTFSTEASHEDLNSIHQDYIPKHYQISSNNIDFKELDIIKDERQQLIEENLGLH